MTPAAVPGVVVPAGSRPVRVGPSGPGTASTYSISCPFSRSCSSSTDSSFVSVFVSVPSRAVEVWSLCAARASLDALYPGGCVGAAGRGESVTVGVSGVPPPCLSLSVHVRRDES